MGPLVSELKGPQWALQYCCAKWQKSSVSCLPAALMFGTVLQSSMDEASSCGQHGEAYQLEVTSTMTRLDYFSGQFSNVLITSIAIFSLGEQTVANLGTSKGRVIQVGDTPHLTPPFNPNP